MIGEPYHVDFETGSTVDLKKSGVHRYAADPSTRVWGFAFRQGLTGAVRQWRPGQAFPQDLVDHITAGGIIVAHNSAFERIVWNWVLRRDLPWLPALHIEQMDCTMQRAAVIAHPLSLEMLGDALHASLRKDKVGSAAMRKMMRPRRVNEDGSLTWWHEDGVEGAELYDTNMAYCEQDVRAETEADKLVPPLSPTWREVWLFDQRINDRGVCFDMPMARRATELVALTKKNNNAVVRKLTKHKVGKCTSDSKIVEFISNRGIECTSLKKGVVDDVLFMADMAGDQVAVDVIKLRQAAWKSSTAKYKAMSNAALADDKIYGTTYCHAASTGRWGGRIVQPQNFKRVDPDDEALQERVRFVGETLRNEKLSIKEVYALLTSVHGEVEIMELLSCALRSTIIASPGKRFVSGDFSNVEGRVNSWLAGEQWKLDAFRAYDEGTGPDLYKLAYARSFNENVEDIGKGHKRQIGKVQELSMGYQGSVGAYLSMGANYGVNPYVLASQVKQTADIYQWAAVEATYGPAKNKMGLKSNEWTALKIIVDNWRAANPKVVQSWWDYQDAAIEAVGSPGTVVATADGRIQYYSDQRTLWCVLPSGRMLAYSQPTLEREEREMIGKDGQPYTRVSYKVAFFGTNSMTKQWERQYLYGGLQCENVVQATSVDLLIYSMINVENAGYPVVLTVHDEILTEVDLNDTTKNEHEFTRVMEKKPAWAEGLPLTVGAWEDTRYVK